MTDRLYLQVKAWHLDTAEPLFNVNDTGAVILGVLEEAVVSLADGGLVTISNPANGAKRVENHLENSQRSVTLLCAVTSPKRNRLLIVSKEGYLYQVCLFVALIST